MTAGTWQVAHNGSQALTPEPKYRVLRVCVLRTVTLIVSVQYSCVSAVLMLEIIVCMRG